MVDGKSLGQLFLRRDVGAFGPLPKEKRLENDASSRQVRPVVVAAVDFSDERRRKIDSKSQTVDLERAWSRARSTLNKSDEAEPDGDAVESQPRDEGRKRKMNSVPTYVAAVEIRQWHCRRFRRSSRGRRKDDGILPPGSEVGDGSGRKRGERGRNSL